jgi:hypothetical protein
MEKGHGKPGGGNGGEDSGIHAEVLGASGGRPEANGHVEPPDP